MKNADPVYKDFESMNEEIMKNLSEVGVANAMWKFQNLIPDFFKSTIECQRIPTSIKQKLAELLEVYDEYDVILRHVRKAAMNTPDLLLAAA